MILPDYKWEKEKMSEAVTGKPLVVDNGTGLSKDSHGYALTTYTFTADRLREA